MNITKKMTKFINKPLFYGYVVIYIHLSNILLKNVNL